MKTLLRSSAIILIFSLGFIACSNSDDTTDVTGTPQGNWRVSLYFDGGDETYKFDGYAFNFGSNNTVTATNGAIVKTGTWSQTSTKLILDFSADAVFSDLNDDWQIVEKTTTSIKLKDDNPDQDDRLEFVKL